MTLLQSGIAKSGAAYTIDQSLRFNSGDTAFMHRTPASAGDRKTWTFSTWAKRVDLASEYIFAMVGGYNDAGWFTFEWASTGTIAIVPGYNYNQYVTTELYRDFGAWYHLCLRCDTTQSSWDDRLRLYVNGVLQTLVVSSAQSSGEPAQDAIFGINDDEYHTIGKYQHGTKYLNGYLAETYLIDGTSLGPGSFAETDSDTNQWKPIDASGLTFGTNGFYLKFQDSSDFGDDSSGEGNDWTVTNLVATDQMIDVPTNNFATMNPLDINRVNAHNTAPIFTEGNLKTVTAKSGASNSSQCCGTFAMLAGGKWGFKYTHTVGNTDPQGEMIGIIKTEGYSQLTYLHNQDMAWFYYAANGYAYHDGSGSSFGTALEIDDYLEFLLDTAGGTLKVKLNGVLIGTNMFASLDNTNYLVAFDGDSTFDMGGVFDFGQSGYEPSDSDYKTLCTDNLSAPEIALPGENFNTIIYSGDDANPRTLTGVGFQADLSWIKSRTGAYSHQLFDAVRGVGEVLYSDNTSAEYSDSATGHLSAWTADGYTVSGSSNTEELNDTGQNYVAWNWLAGGAPTDTNIATTGVMTSGSVFQNGVSNTSFTPGSSVYPDKISANTTNGFSIVNVPTTGSALTAAHGLSQAPELIIAKSMDKVDYWPVGATALASGWTKFLVFSGTDVVGTGDSLWNDTAPTASLFTIGTQNAFNNAGENTIFYCFHSVEGYSKVGGSYEGNGTVDGTFIYTGFSPAYLIIKRIDSATNWFIHDDKRSTYNVIDGETLKVNTATVEVSDTGMAADFDSNGFKLRTSDDGYNGATNTYLYLAFAESPFKYANAR